MRSIENKPADNVFESPAGVSNFTRENRLVPPGRGRLIGDNFLVSNCFSTCKMSSDATSHVDDLRKGRLKNKQAIEVLFCINI